MSKIKHETMVEYNNGGKMVRMVDENGKLIGHQYVPPPFKVQYQINASIAPRFPYLPKEKK